MTEILLATMMGFLTIAFTVLFGWLFVAIIKKVAPYMTCEGIIYLIILFFIILVVLVCWTIGNAILNR